MDVFRKKKKTGFILIYILFWRVNLMFECPQCHKKTFTRWQKVLCGSMKSKGRKCPECGCHCVNGMESTIFRLTVSILPLIYFLYVSKAGIGSETFRVFTFAGAMILGFLLGKLFDAFFGNLIKSLRLDITE